MLKNASAPVGTEIEEVDLMKLFGSVDASDELGMPELGIDEVELGEDDDEDSLGELGARHRRRRRRSRRARRRGRKGGRKGGRRKGRGKIRMPKGKSKKARAARGRAIAKLLTRTKTGRFKSLHGIEGLADGATELSDLMALSAMDSLGELGAGKRRRRKGRKGSRKSRRKGSRRGRRRSRRSRGMSGLADVGNGLAAVEVANSMPVVGVFQYLATPAGMEALGGVALGAVVPSLIGRGIFGKLVGAKLDAATGQPADWYWDVVSTLVSSVSIWEFGRLIGAGNAAKFGAFYALGGLLERWLLKPWVVDKVLPLSGMGLGQVLFPGIKRPDYAVNPLSGMGTVRIPDTEELRGLGTVRIPDQDSMGTVRIPDTEMVGVGADIVTDEEMVGADDATEDSEIF